MSISHWISAILSVLALGATSMDRAYSNNRYAKKGI